MCPTISPLNGVLAENSPLASNRSIIVDVHAFGSLRKDLIRNIGLERTKGFLFRYGWDLGIRDARECKENESYNTLEELIAFGPVVHSLKGFVVSKTLKLVVKKEDNILHLLMESVWQDSYEASEHINQIGVSSVPVCYTLAGYASGFVSEVTGERVIFKEVCCCGAGGSECRAVGKTAAEWGNEIKDELYYLQETPILDELELTYEKLLHERDNRATASAIHKKLTEEVIKGNNLDSIIQEVFKLTKIPIVILTNQLQPLAYAGLSSIFLDITSNEFVQFIKEKINKSSFSYTNQKRLQQFESYYLLTSPIYIHDKLTGFCFFIFKNIENYQEDLSNMIIEKVSSVCSLCLFYERAKLDSFEQMKGFFFDEILNGHYSSNEEIIAKGSFIQLDLAIPYWVGVIDHSIPHTDFLNELEFHKELMDVISDYCIQQKRHFLISQSAKRIILLITERQEKRTDKNSIFTDIYHFLLNKYPNNDFYIGISKETNSIKDAANAYNEAIAAIRMVSKSNGIITFDSLGILGVLINENNENEVRRMAQIVLGKLTINCKKNIELIVTLYSFLMNGGNLEKTAEEVALSISGLRYRIIKIEELLQRDIRDPITSYQLLLSIQALNIIGDLDFKDPSL